MPARNNALIAQTLVDAGANVNARGKEGQSALAIAASAGHMEVLNVFLKQPTIDLNSQVLASTVHHVTLDWLPLPCIALIRSSQLSYLEPR